VQPETAFLRREHSRCRRARRSPSTTSPDGDAAVIRFSINASGRTSFSNDPPEQHDVRWVFQAKIRAGNEPKRKPARDGAVRARLADIVLIVSPR